MDKLKYKIFFVFFIFIYSCSNIVTCPSFNQDYFIWFPYKVNDTIVLESETNSRKYVISSYIANHRNSYDSNLKCGCCEEGIRLQLVSKEDTLDIDFQNLDNKESCFGLQIIINGYDYLISNKHNKDSLLFEIKAKSGSFKNMDTLHYIILEKNKGLVELKYNNKTWSMTKYQKNPKSENIKIEIEKCF